MSHHRFALLAFAFAAAAATSLTAPRADACSPPFCYARTPYLLPAGAGETIPSNAPGIAVFSGFVNPGQPEPGVKLRKVTNAGAVDVAITIAENSPLPDLITPTGGFEAGATYELEADHSCGERDGGAGTNAKTTFTVGAAAPAPASLGTLTVSPSRVGELQVASGASCSETISAAQADVAIALSPEARAWAPLLAYETYVDGERWRASKASGDQFHRAGSWAGIGKDLLYAACSADAGVGGQGLTAGVHTVQMKAYLPWNSATPIEAPAVQVTLSCLGARPFNEGLIEGPGSPQVSCAMSGGMPASSWFGAALATLAVAAGIRRRRPA